MSGKKSPHPEPRPHADAPDWDPVDEASWESFPASDPPAISSTAVELAHEKAEARSFDDAERRALHDALDWAYRAAAGLEQVILSRGSSPALLALRRSQARQVEALREQFAVHGLTVPDDAWAHVSARGVSGPETVDAVVAAAVRAEQGACEAYERLARSTDRGEALAVYRELLRVSQEQHLPALRRDHP